MAFDGNLFISTDDVQNGQLRRLYEGGKLISIRLGGVHAFSSPLEYHTPFKEEFFAILALQADELLTWEFQ